MFCFVLFDFQSAHQASTNQVLSPFNLLQMQNACRVVDIEFLGKFSCSSRGSALMMALNWCHNLPMASHYAVHLQDPCLLCKASWAMTIHSLIVPGSNALLMLKIVSAVLQPILNLNKKIAQICFLTNIISIV